MNRTILASIVAIGACALTACSSSTGGSLDLGGGSTPATSAPVPGSGDSGSGSAGTDSSGSAGTDGGDAPIPGGGSASTQAGGGSGGGDVSAACAAYQKGKAANDQFDTLGDDIGKARDLVNEMLTDAQTFADSAPSEISSEGSGLVTDLTAFKDVLAQSKNQADLQAKVQADSSLSGKLSDMEDKYSAIDSWATDNC